MLRCWDSEELSCSRTASFSMITDWTACQHNSWLHVYDNYWQEVKLSFSNATVITNKCMRNCTWKVCNRCNEIHQAKHQQAWQMLIVKAMFNGQATRWWWWWCGSSVWLQQSDAAAPGGVERLERPRRRPSGDYPGTAGVRCARQSAGQRPADARSQGGAGRVTWRRPGAARGRRRPEPRRQHGPLARARRRQTYV